ncbi:hypothetical protein AAMO2058_000949000 [Amorphochlora amoebiformis]
MGGHHITATVVLVGLLNYLFMGYILGTTVTVFPPLRHEAPLPSLRAEVGPLPTPDHNLKAKAVQIPSSESKHKEKTTESNARPGFVCDTTKGQFEVELNPDLAPRSVDRLLDFVRSGYFNQSIAFFRVNQWITQFGVDHHFQRPDKFKELRNKAKQDENPYGPRDTPEDYRKRKAHPWERGTYAWIGGTHMLIVRKGNPEMGTNLQDAPAGRVVRGMEGVIDRLDNSYGNAVDNAGQGPDQTKLAQEGPEYIHREFPKTDFITSCWER